MGAVLAAIACAIRTDTAYGRFLATAGASDVIVTPADSGIDGYYSALAKLPGRVASASPFPTSARAASRPPT